jgi:branched-chain amino acid aminotransferase
MSQARAFWNGTFVAQERLAIPYFDAGFVFGATVTDLCRTIRHELYRWQDHLARFRASCARIPIELAMSDAELTARACELVAHNARLLRGEQDLALVLFATPGAVAYYLGEPQPSSEAGPSFGMHTFPLPFERYRPFFREGVHLVVPSVRQVSTASLDPRIKQRSRLHWWIAQQETQRLSAQRHAMAILLNERDEVTETASANFLIVKANTVLTPPRDTVLNGVSLNVVEEMCHALGIRFEERALTVADCLAADEAMVTSTPFCLAGVSRFQAQPLPWPGPVFERLLRVWSEEIGLDIRGQIEAEAAVDQRAPAR